MGKMTNSKNAFWQALVFSVIIFLVGLALGFFLEVSRGEGVEKILLNSEVNILDEQLRGIALDDYELDCGFAKHNTFAFADRIYGEALKLETLDGASTFRDELVLLHKRYDLLRLMLWNQARDVRSNCSEDFHIAVYFFEYDIEDIDKRAKQGAFSKVLTDLKNNHPEDVLIIPVAGNLELFSIEVVKANYGVSEMPAILVDGEVVIEDLIDYSELEEIVFSN